MRHLWGALAVVASLTLSSVSWAQSNADRQAARALAISGRSMFEAGDYAEALDRFRQAEALIHAPPHVLYIARAQEKQGQLLAARDSYARLVAEPLTKDAHPAFKRAVEEGKAELGALDARIPKLSISVEGLEGGTATITVDGRPASSGALQVMPGEHVVAAAADGFDGATETVSMAESETREVTLVLTADRAGQAVVAPPEAEDAGGQFPIFPVAVIGAGVVGIVIGGVTGGVALGKADDLKAACEGLDPCPRDNEALADDANTLATVSTISFIVGGALAAGGTAWLVIELLGGGDERADTAWKPLVAPGYVGVKGAF